MRVPPLGPPSRVRVEDDRTSMHPEALHRAYHDHIQFSRARDLEFATPFDRFVALALSARDRLVLRWTQTQRTYYEKDVKRAYYLSAEFLPGRCLLANLQALGIYDLYRTFLADLGVDLDASSRPSPTRASATAASGASRRASWTRRDPRPAR
jgi:starch phosphorylase